VRRGDSERASSRAQLHVQGQERTSSRVLLHDRFAALRASGIAIEAGFASPTRTGARTVDATLTVLPPRRRCCVRRMLVNGRCCLDDSHHLQAGDVPPTGSSSRDGLRGRPVMSEANSSISVRGTSRAAWWSRVKASGFRAVPIYETRPWDGSMVACSSLRRSANTIRWRTRPAGRALGARVLSGASWEDQNEKCSAGACGSGPAGHHVAALSTACAARPHVVVEESR
jgi:hypothetical protein